MNLPILIPASQKKTDGYSLLPLNLLTEERLWPAKDEDGYLEIDGTQRRWTPSVSFPVEQIFLSDDGHDLRTEERDIKTGEWRQRKIPMAAKTAQVKNGPKHAGRHPGLPLREVAPIEYSRPALLKCLGPLKTDHLTAVTSFLTALKKGKAVDIKQAAIQAISTEYAASARARRDELTKLLINLNAAPSDCQRLEAQFHETEKRLSDRVAIDDELKKLSDREMHTLVTHYVGSIIFCGRVIFWTKATRVPQISPGIFFPNFKAAIASAVLLEGELRRCLNPKCGRIFSASRYDGVCCNLRCSNAFRQFRHTNKARKVAANRTRLKTNS